MSEIYFNSNILTMDEKYPRAEAVLIKEGRIAKCGTNQEVLACKETDTRCIDLNGKTMLPGFLDGHSHFAGLATSLAQCDLSKTNDFNDIVCLMKDFIGKNQIKAGEWVIGTNYDHNFLSEKRHPDKTVLDSISTEHPIVIVHASSHMGVANSAALLEQKLGNKTEDPAGGHYGRVGESTEPNGYMEENAFVNFRNAMPLPKIEDILQNFKKAQEIYASFGITTIQEGMVTAPLFQILQYAEKKNVFYLDLAGYVDLENSEKLLLEHQEYKNHYTNHLKMGGYKIFLDGSPQGRTAWMKEPYENAENGYCGYPIKTDEQLYKLILTALKNGQQLLAHCNGDAAAEQYITQFENVLRDYPQYDAKRPVMIHAQLVQKEQLERMRKIPMMPSFFAAHTWYWGDIHTENFGIERAKNISPAGTALRLGLPFTFHQDSPVLIPDVFETIWCATKRVTKTGVQLSENEKISVYDALGAMTVYAAYQYGEEAEKGSITEGKLADLILVDKNPLEIPEDEVKNIKVLATFKEGKVVYRRDSGYNKKQ